MIADKLVFACRRCVKFALNLCNNNILADYYAVLEGCGKGCIGCAVIILGLNIYRLDIVVADFFMDNLKISADVCYFIKDGRYFVNRYRISADTRALLIVD